MRPRRRDGPARDAPRDAPSRVVRRARREPPPVVAHQDVGAPRRRRRIAARLAIAAAALSCVALAVVAIPWGRAAPDAAGACAHPFVPSRAGTRLQYAWTTGAAAGELVLTLSGAVPRGHTTELRWESSMTGAGPVVTGAFVRSCSAESAQEAWFGFPQPGGVEIVAPTWTWPAELARGTRFRGVFVVRAFGRERAIERRHHVVGRETVRVPAGAFHAVRVEAEDIGERGGPPGHGTYWIAERVGLVRSEESSAAGHATYALSDAAIPSGLSEE